jgi:hypothetical protein
MKENISKYIHFTAGCQKKQVLYQWSHDAGTFGKQNNLLNRWKVLSRETRRVSVVFVLSTPKHRTSQEGWQPSWRVAQPSWRVAQPSWKVMESYGRLWSFCGRLWKVVESYGRLWKFVIILWKPYTKCSQPSITFHNFPQPSITFHKMTTTFHNFP